MPQAVIRFLGRCAGGDHISAEVIIAGVARAVTFNFGDLREEPKRRSMKEQMRHAVKDAGATNFAQAKAAIEAATFDVIDRDFSE